MKKIFLILFIFPIYLQANEGFSNKIYDAFVQNKMGLWEQTIQQMEQTYEQTKNTELLLDLNYANYGYIAYLIGTENKSKAKAELEVAEGYLNQLIVSGKFQSQAHALEGAFYGFKIGLAKAKAPILGPKSLNSINKSIELDKSNPTAWLEKANSLYYMPAAFGGSKEVALIYYHKAVQLFEKQNEKNNWMYLNTMTVLAQAYQDTGNYQEAFDTYQKILKQEPNFKWVKDELLPKLMAEM